MKNLLLRTLLVSLLLSGACAVIVLVARANPAPNRLQALGFDLCAGEPCFRGIKPGVVWTEVSRVLPQVVSAFPMLEFPINRVDNTSAVFYPSRSGKVVETIELKLGVGLQHGLTIGDVVARLGQPCRIVFFAGTRGGTIANVTFPGVTLNVFVPMSEAGIYRLRYDLPINIVWLASNDLARAFCNCEQDAAAFQDCNAWNGFTSMVVYHARVKRLNRVSP
jgi:hypothetical protein